MRLSPLAALVLSALRPATGQSPSVAPMSQGPALGVPAVVGIRNPGVGQPDAFLFKRPGYQALPAAPIPSALPGPGTPLITAEALHLKDVNSWTQLIPSPAPAARAGAVLVWHAARGQAVLFGGGTNGPTLLGDTWEWNGSVWSQPAPAMAPAARAQAAAAYDALRQRVVLLGGLGAGGALGDTWEWTGTVWQQRATTTAPVARRSHALAYDAARGRTVLFGGFSSAAASPLGDTWEWDGTTWTQRFPASAPAARSGHALAYDAARQRVVLFGGRGAALLPLDETWEWDGTAWTQRTFTVAPPARYDHALAWDSARQRVMLTGGILNPVGVCDLWEYDGSQWCPRHPFAAPPARQLTTLAFEPATSSLLLFGGIRDLSGTFFFGDTWRWALGTPNTIAINDISIGQDFIPALGNAIDVPPMSWVGVAYSVTSTTAGASGVVAAETGGGNGVGGDVFNYVLGTSSSQCLPANEIGLITKAVDSDEGTVSGGADVNGLDLFLPAYNMDPSFFLTPPSTQPTVYFTVRSSSLNDVPREWWENSAPSGATILRTTWDPATGNWSCPTVLCRYSDILISGVPLLETEEIDALAIDAARGNMVFSTRRLRSDNQPTAAPSQLMITAVTCDTTTAATLVYPNSYMGGAAVADQLDLGLGGDLDAVCIYDPCNQTVPGRDLFAHIMGARNPPVVQFGGVVPQTSAWRDHSSVGNALITSTAGGPRPAISLVLITDFVTLPFSIYFQAAFLAGGGGFPGSPVTATFPLPNGPLSGSIGIHWVDVDLNTSQLFVGPALLFQF